LRRTVPSVRCAGKNGARVKATVLVRPKQGILDPQGEAVENALGHLGFSIASARIGKVVDLELEASDADDARAQVEQMCEQLLANSLIESYEVEIHG
jgi:phosphoribosylformylglycinamidine synthase subunit PurS